MNKILRIPNEPRFVRAFALAVDPGDTLSLLLEIGAVGNQDLAIVRRTREALDPACDRANEHRDWEQVHTISILREALVEPDAAAFLACQVEGCRQSGHLVTAFAEALAVVGCAADRLSTRRRPWEILTDDLYLPEWRERIRKLLFALPGNALPKPPNPPGSTGSETDRLTALTDQHAGRHQAN